HYKELSDSIKTTRAKIIEHTTSLIAQNAKFKAQLQEKGFAIATLKNELRKLNGNSMDTKFAKPSILGKLVLQSLRNKLVVRQPTAFKNQSRIGINRAVLRARVSTLERKRRYHRSMAITAEQEAMRDDADRLTRYIQHDRARKDARDPVRHDGPADANSSC
ncbi:hypothetical protein Tco_1469649, partial [Tanacetum coccineum]